MYTKSQVERGCHCPFFKMNVVYLVAFVAFVLKRS